MSAELMNHIAAPSLRAASMAPSTPAFRRQGCIVLTPGWAVCPANGDK